MKAKELNLDMGFYKDDTSKYSLGDKGINEMYKDALDRFDGNYDEFLRLIDNDEHKMYIKWNSLRNYAERLGKVK